MKKVVIAAIALFAFGNFAFADLVVDLELTTLASGVNTDPLLAGSGSHTLSNIAVNSTSPIYVWVYGEVVNGPVTPNGTFNNKGSLTQIVGPINDALLTTLQGNVSETVTAAGLNGNMTWGTTHSTTATKKTYLYVDSFGSGFCPALPGDLNAAGDYDLNTHYFDPANTSGGIEGLDTWIVLGHFTYTPKAGATAGGSAKLTFTPLTTIAGATYQLGNADSGTFSDGLGGDSGFTTTGALTMTVIPEPSTLILLGMGVLSLLLIRRRK
ncbi:MAG: PEP-CTERM sorting domain-containing protein [Thermoguttaceae bacterium]